MLEVLLLFARKQMSSDSFKNTITYKLFTHKSYVQPFNCMQKKWALPRLKMLSTNYVFIYHM